MLQASTFPYENLSLYFRRSVSSVAPIRAIHEMSQSRRDLPPKAGLFNVEQHFVPPAKQHTHSSLAEQMLSKPILKERNILLKATWSEQFALGHKGDGIFTLLTKWYQTPVPILLLPDLFQAFPFVNQLTNQPTKVPITASLRIIELSTS